VAEGGGKTDAAARMSAEEIWGLWRRLLRLLPVWRMPWEWVFSPSVWTMAGLDLVSGLLRNRSTQAAFALLEPLPPADLRRLHALAALNQRRHEVISKWTALAFVTVPTSAALALSELSPATLASITAHRGLATWYFVLGYVGAVVAFYLLSAWRARQLLTVVELAFIARGVAFAGEEADLDEPWETPLGG
jgi:hypothetical protein